MNARLSPAAIASLSGRTTDIHSAAVVHGEIGHRRSRPAVNAFRYPAFCLRLPLSQLATLPASGIAWNRGGPVSFHDRDHGPRDGSPLEVWLRGVLAREGLPVPEEIVLYAFPRMLGYVFNPVSFWVCHLASGAIGAVLVEVNNTFGETHQYLLAHPGGEPLVSGETLCARKVFHVSPFCEVRGHYTFRFHFGADRWLARIDHFDGASEAALLETHISGQARPLLPGAGRALLWQYRWFTLAVLARIHWQALRLWAKRVPFFTKPRPPADTLTRNL
jgi:DUF1365 family protein